MTFDLPEMSWDPRCLSPSGLLMEFLCGVLGLLSRRTKGVSVIRGTERRESLGITGSRLPVCRGRFSQEMYRVLSWEGSASTGAGGGHRQARDGSGSGSVIGDSFLDERAHEMYII